VRFRTILAEQGMELATARVMTWGLSISWTRAALDMRAGRRAQSRSSTRDQTIYGEYVACQVDMSVVMHVMDMS
jgi:hypothetical protein